MTYQHKSLALILLLTGSLLVSGCDEEKTAETKPPVVKVRAAGTTTDLAVANYPGTVKGRYETNLSFQVAGQIVGRSVQTGSRVNAGDVLMVIDPKDVVETAKAAEAQVASAQAQLELAKVNLARYQELYSNNAVAEATLDQYRTNYEAAFAAYQSAIAKAAQSHNSLGYTQLTVGAGGVITNVSAEVGQVVAAGQTVMTLVQDGELEVEINIPESRLPDAQIGAPALVSFWAYPARTLGEVREVSPMADAAARTYRVRISLPEPPPGLTLGMTATAILGNEEEAAGISLLPLSAVYQTGEGPKVWRITPGNKAELVSVRVASFGDNSVLVKGLNPTDMVVTAGVTRLLEGQEVRPSREDADQ